MRNKPVLALFAMMIVGATAISGAYAFGGNLLGSNAAREALESGDYEAFIAAAQDRVSDGMTEERFERMAERHEARQAIQTALESNDYQAWVEAVEAAKPPSITEVITEENFDEFVAMHEAKKDGDLELAMELAENLGLEHPGPGM